MKFHKRILFTVLNAVAVQSFSMPYRSFEDVLSDRAVSHQLTHNHQNLLDEPDQTSGISKILQFQKGKILRAQNKHFNQGNMNRSSRAEFLENLGKRFKNVRAYSKKRIQNNNQKISRRGVDNRTSRFRKLRAPRRRFKLLKSKRRFWKCSKDFIIGRMLNTVSLLI